MGARWSEGWRGGRTSKMLNTNRDGRNRNLDDLGSKVATQRPPAISGFAGSTRKFLAVVRRALS
jgi:hypothetical protein